MVNKLAEIRRRLRGVKNLDEIARLRAEYASSLIQHTGTLRIGYYSDAPVVDDCRRAAAVLGNTLATSSLIPQDFPPNTFDYEPEGRMFESCRAHHKSFRINKPSSLSSLADYSLCAILLTYW